MVYFLVLSALSIIATLYDKLAARFFKRFRIPEISLLTLAAMGGSVTMLITMIIIRHKTRKYKFMVGIPIIIILQVIALYTLKKLGYF